MKTKLVPVGTSGQFMLPMALGGRLVDQHLANPLLVLDREKMQVEHRAVYDSVMDGFQGPGEPSFLDTALCAMSLPVNRPANEFDPIIRRDGKHSLIINPGERPVLVDGKFEMRKAGAPFGKYARLVMIFLMTQAVRYGKREIYLGESFSAWMRSLNIDNVSSGGRDGVRTKVYEQFDRLMACEFTISWDSNFADNTDTGPRRVGRPKKMLVEGSDAPSMYSRSEFKLSDQYDGIRTRDGHFCTRIVLSEKCFERLIMRTVPMNERAVAILKDSPTALDLYTYLAMRLPKIPKGEEVRLTWEQLELHLGTSSGKHKLRQGVRRAWQHVSGVYQQARHSADFSGSEIVLRYSDRPTEGHLTRQPDRSFLPVWSDKHRRIEKPVFELVGSQPVMQLSAPELRFPSSGTIRYEAEPTLLKIGKEHGQGHDVDLIADAFRKKLISSGDVIENVTGPLLVKRWTAFCKSFKPRG